MLKKREFIPAWTYLILYFASNKLKHSPYEQHNNVQLLGAVHNCVNLAILMCKNRCQYFWLFVMGITCNICSYVLTLINL